MAKKIAFVLREKLQWLDSLNQWTTFSVKCFRKGREVYERMIDWVFFITIHAGLIRLDSKSEKFFPGNNYSSTSLNWNYPNSFSLQFFLIDLKMVFQLVLFKGISTFHLLTQFALQHKFYQQLTNTILLISVKFSFNAGSNWKEVGSMGGLSVRQITFCRLI